MGPGDRLIRSDVEENKTKDALSPETPGERRDFRVKMTSVSVSLKEEGDDGGDAHPYSAAAHRRRPRAVTERAECIGDAQILDRGGVLTLLFDDTLEDADLPALTSVYFEKERPGIVTVERSGVIQSTMIFEQGCRHRAKYRTFCGSCDMTVYCRRVENALTADGGTLELEYNVEFRGAAEQKVSLTLEVERVDMSAARRLRDAR